MRRAAFVLASERLRRFSPKFQPGESVSRPLLPDDLAAARARPDRFAGAQEGELHAGGIGLVAAVRPERLHPGDRVPAPDDELRATVGVVFGQLADPIGA